MFEGQTAHWLWTRIRDKPILVSLGMFIDTGFLAAVTESLFVRTATLSVTSLAAVPTMIWALFAIGLVLMAIDLFLGMKLLVMHLR